MSLQLYRVVINLSFGAMCFLLVSSASADTSSGLDAFEKGDFQKAHALLLPLAETGDADAEYAVGLMYLKGLGLEQEVLAARFWIARSAERGNTAASDALQKIEDLLEQKYSRGLPRVDGADGSSRERAIFLPDAHSESAGIRTEHLIVGFFFFGVDVESAGCDEWPISAHLRRDHLGEKWRSARYLFRYYELVRAEGLISLELKAWKIAPEEGFEPPPKESLSPSLTRGSTVAVDSVDHRGKPRG
ncbi:MAG: sel1 repeat family protein [Rhodospirillaceae bacterium]|nr:sel1 repeat family protein [Rhodospirillaceae bacterium]